MNTRGILVGVLIAALSAAGCSPHRTAPGGAPGSGGPGSAAPASTRASASTVAPEPKPAAAASATGIAAAAGTAAAPTAAAAPASAATPAAANREGAPRAIRLGPVAPSQQPPAHSELQGTDRLLPLRSGGSLYPYDFEIGPLAHPSADAPAQRAVGAVIESFFASFARGEIDDSIVAARWSDSINRELSFAVGHKLFPTETRVGQISVSGDGASAPVRLSLGAARASGTVYLELADRAWYISDVQIDWSELARPFVRTEPYEPTSWQWLLKR